MNAPKTLLPDNDRDLLSRLFTYDAQRDVWTYAHDDRVFKVIAACAKLNIPCRNVPKDDPQFIEIDDQEWQRLLIASIDKTIQKSELASEKIKENDHMTNDFVIRERHSSEDQGSHVRYYQFHSDDEGAASLAPEIVQSILAEAEAEMAEDEEEQDMETAVHALAERTEAVIPIKAAPPMMEKKQDHDHDVMAAEKPMAVSPPAPKHPPKETPITQNTKADTMKNANIDKNFGDLSSWEQVLEDREATLAAREKVLRLRQKDLQDTEERFHDERKTFNADYEEKKAFLEDKEQRLRKLFERIEEVAYEFRRSNRTDAVVD